MESTTEETVALPAGLKAFKEKQKKDKELAKQTTTGGEGESESDAPETAPTSQPRVEKQPEVKDEKPTRFVADPKKIYIFESIVKSKTPRHEIIGSTCTIFDPIQGRPREIRYIPIANTIFVDEMGERYKHAGSYTISLYNNRLEVPGTDARLVEYLMAHDSFDGNENRLSRKPAEFTLLNKADAELKKEERYNAELKALNVINDTDIKELLPVARIVFNILETDSLSVKNKLREQAKTRPMAVLNNIDNPRTIRGYLVQAALDHGVIEVDQENRCLIWKEVKVVIIPLMSEKASEQVTEITDFSFTTEGSKFYDILKQKVKV